MPVPSGVALLAELEGQAARRGEREPKMKVLKPAGQDRVYSCIDACNVAAIKGSTAIEVIQDTFAARGLVICVLED